LYNNINCKLYEQKMAKRYDDFSRAKENENTIMLMKLYQENTKKRHFKYKKCNSNGGRKTQKL